MSTAIKRTRGAYEQYLNELFPEYNEERMAYLLTKSRKPTKMRKALDRGNYGKLLRLHDPVAFSVGYGEWAGEY